MQKHRESESPLDKWKLGMARLEQSKTVPEMLDLAMLSIHGALEDQFRHKLSSAPKLTDVERQRVKKAKEVQWVELCSLMQQHFGLSKSDKDYILDMNALRIPAGHGFKFKGSYQQVFDYAKFVQKWFGIKENLFDILHEKLREKSVSSLIYVGIVMALCVQLFSANHWPFLWFKSYETPFAIAFFIFACGVSYTAQIWQNYWVAAGVFVATIGGYVWKYKWVIPILKTDGSVLFTLGIGLLLYGIVPQFLGFILIIPGSFYLSVELFSMFTKGFAAVHFANLILGAVLMGLSALMFNRHKKLQKVGVFRAGR